MMRRWEVKVMAHFPMAAICGQQANQELEGQRRIFRWRWRARLYAWHVEHCGVLAPIWAEITPLEWPAGSRRRSWLGLKRAGVIVAAPILPWLVMFFHALVGLVFTVAALIGPGDQTRWAAICEAWRIVYACLVADMEMAGAMLRKIWLGEPWQWHGFEE